MSAAIVHVIATVRTKEGKRADFIEAFKKLVPLVLAEEGCIEYGPTVDVQTVIPIQGPARENHVIIIEKWASIEALYAHLKAPHMAEWGKISSEFAEEVTLQVMNTA